MPFWTPGYAGGSYEFRCVCWSVSNAVFLEFAHYFPASMCLGEDLLKTSSAYCLPRRVQDVFARRLPEDVLEDEKLLRSRRIQDMLENKKRLLGFFRFFRMKLRFNKHKKSDGAPSWKNSCHGQNGLNRAFLGPASQFSKPAHYIFLKSYLMGDI